MEEPENLVTYRNECNAYSKGSNYPTHLLSIVKINVNLKQLFNTGMTKIWLV